MGKYIINFFCFWLFQIPGAYFVALHLEWGPVGVFGAITTSEILIAIVSIFLFRKGTWKTKEV